MKKFGYAFIILALGLASVFFINMGALNLPNNLTVHEAPSYKLNSEIQLWAKDKPLGVYLYHSKVGELNKYLVYTKKELTYSYRTARAEMGKGILRIHLTTIDAGNDDQCKAEQFFIVDTQETPEKIELYVDGKEDSFREIFEGK